MFNENQTLLSCQYWDKDESGAVAGLDINDCPISDFPKNMRLGQK